MPVIRSFSMHRRRISSAYVDQPVSDYRTLPAYRVRSHGGSLLYRQARSAIGAKANQRDALRSLGLTRIDSLCVVDAEDSSTWGQIVVAGRLVERLESMQQLYLPKGRFIFLPYGDGIFASSKGGSSSMKGGLEVIYDKKSGNAFIESEEGEYVQFQPHERSNTITWTVDDAGFRQIVKNAERLFGIPDEDQVSILGLHGKDVRDVMPTDQALNVLVEHVGDIDFASIDIGTYSVSWVSPRLPNAFFATEAGHGELSVVCAKGYSNIVESVMRTSATPKIGHHAVAILSQLLRRPL